MWLKDRQPNGWQLWRRLKAVETEHQEGNEQPSCSIASQFIHRHDTLEQYGDTAAFDVPRFSDQFRDRDPAAIALGACVIEKHFTLDQT